MQAIAPGLAADVAAAACEGDMCHSNSSKGSKEQGSTMNAHTFMTTLPQRRSNTNSLRPLATYSISSLPKRRKGCAGSNTFTSHVTHDV
jgi:hypothetical protein